MKQAQLSTQYKNSQLKITITNYIYLWMKIIININEDVWSCSFMNWRKRKQGANNNMHSYHDPTQTVTGFNPVESCTAGKFHQQSDKLDQPCSLVSWSTLTQCTRLSFNLFVSSIIRLLLLQPTRCLSDAKPNIMDRSAKRHCLNKVLILPVCRVYISLKAIISSQRNI